MNRGQSKEQQPLTRPVLGWFCAIAYLLTASVVRPDQVEMQNGDRYLGRVVSLTNDTLIVQSDNLGVLRLPRASVARITLGQAPVAASAKPPTTPPRQKVGDAPATTNSSADLASALRNAGVSTNLVQQVQKQFLGDAGPEATDKFNELLSGYLSGNLSVNDIRAQAKSAANQLRELKRDGGEEAGLAVDTYLAILDHFLKETEPPAGSATNQPSRSHESPGANK